MPRAVRSYPGSQGKSLTGPSGTGRALEVRPTTVAVFSGGGTGGHLYPALALAEALQAIRPDVRPFFVGARRGLEARILPEGGLEHLLLPVLGFRRGAIWGNLSVLAALLRSLLLTGLTFTRLRPAMVVVTGGYAGGPAGIMAGIMGIPLALQEQNAYPGVTTRFLSRWSRQTHLAFPEARSHLPRRAQPRTLLSGNPVRTSAPCDPSHARAHFDLDPASRVILVVGGSQGAEALNRATLSLVTKSEEGRIQRPRDVQILWSTGSQHFPLVQAQLDALGNPGWVKALGYIQDVPKALSAATLAVGRAGAMTTAEFLAWGIPALLVPLPTSAEGHQARNAESLADAGAAVHLPEGELDGGSLWEAVSLLLSDPGRLASMREAALVRGRPRATREIAGILEGLLPPMVAGPRGAFS